MSQDTVERKVFPPIELSDDWIGNTAIVSVVSFVSSLVLTIFLFVILHLSLAPNFETSPLLSRYAKIEALSHAGVLVPLKPGPSEGSIEACQTYFSEPSKPLSIKQCGDQLNGDIDRFLLGDQAISTIEAYAIENTGISHLSGDALSENCGSLDGQNSVLQFSYQLDNKTGGNASSGSNNERAARIIVCLYEQSGSFDLQFFAEERAISNGTFERLPIPFRGFQLVEKGGFELYQMRNKPYDMGKEFISYLNDLSADERVDSLNWSVKTPDNPAFTQGYLSYIIPLPFVNNLAIEDASGVGQSDCSAATCFQLAGKNYQTQPDLFARSLLYGSDFVSWSVLFSIYFMMIFGVVFTALRARKMLDLEKWSETVRAELTHPNPSEAEAFARTQIADRQSASAFSSSFFEDYFGAQKREALEQECESKLVDELRRVWFVRYAVWLVPIIGFVGTIIGISMTTPLLGTLITEDSALKARTMQEMGRQLGVAFGTTLAGLLASIVLQGVRFFYEEQFLVKEILRIRSKLVAAANGISVGASAVFSTDINSTSTTEYRPIERQSDARPSLEERPAPSTVEIDAQNTNSGEKFIETAKVAYPAHLDIVWLAIVVGSVSLTFAWLMGLISIGA